MNAKYFLLLSLIVLLKTSFAQDTWYPTHISNIGNPYNDIDMNSVSLNCGSYPSIICGDSGYIGKFFIPDMDGWIFNYPSVTNKSLHSVYELDSIFLMAYIVGDSGLILKSSPLDNYSFVIQKSNIYNHLYSIFFTPGYTGIVVGDSGTVIRTTDGGSHWDLVNKVTTKKILSIQFPSENTGYAVGIDGVVIKTTDNGQNWFLKPMAIADTLYSVWFTSENTGFVVSRNGIILETTNGGDSWINKPSSTNQKLNAIRFLSTNIGYAAGNNNTIVKTTNGGDTWINQSLPPLFRYGHFKSVGMYLDGSVCFVGTNGTAVANFPEPGSISEKYKKNYLILYPNPVLSKINIFIKNMQIFPSSVLSLYDIHGQLLLQQPITNDNTQIDISPLTQGVYIAKIQTKEGTLVQKFIKE